MAPAHLVRGVDLLFRLRLYFEVFASQLKGVDDWEELLDDVGLGRLGLDHALAAHTGQARAGAATATVVIMKSNQASNQASQPTLLPYRSMRFR